MPLFNIESTLHLNPAQKKELALFITKQTVNIFNIFPDKVQVIIKNTDNESSFRAGSSPAEMNFDKESRLNSQDFKESYFDEKLFVDPENLIVISVDTFSGFSWKEKNQLVEKLTDYISSTFKISGDNIIALIRDINPENWYQNGYSGRHNNFLENSRKPKGE